MGKFGNFVIRCVFLGKKFLAFSGSPEVPPSPGCFYLLPFYPQYINKPRTFLISCRYDVCPRTHNTGHTYLCVCVGGCMSIMLEEFDVSLAVLYRRIRLVGSLDLSSYPSFGNWTQVLGLSGQVLYHGATQSSLLKLCLFCVYIHIWPYLACARSGFY